MAIKITIIIVIIVLIITQLLLDEKGEESIGSMKWGNLEAMPNKRVRGEKKYI